jgi:hypothetical protein
MFKRAARDPEIARRFGLPNDGPSESFTDYCELSRAKAATGLRSAKLEERASVSSRSSGATPTGPSWGTGYLPESRGRGARRARCDCCRAMRWSTARRPTRALDVSGEHCFAMGVAERIGFVVGASSVRTHVVDRRREDAVFFSLLPGHLDECAACLCASTSSARP